MDSSPKSFAKAALPLFAILALSSTSSATTIVKASNSTDLNQAGSWVGGVAPGSSDTASWTSVAGSNPTASLNANTSWDTIQVKDSTGTVTINGTGTLTLVGTGSNHGINANSGTTADLTLNCNLVLTPATQTWAIAAGHTLTIGGTATGTNTALTVGSGGGDVNVTGSLITTKSILKNGAGTLRLGGSNTITGGITISTGAVLLTSENAVQSTISTTGASTTVTQIQLSGGHSFGFSPNLGSAHVNAQTTGAHVVNVDGSNTVQNVNFGASAGSYGIRSDSGTLNMTGILGTGAAVARNIEVGGAGNIVVNGAISDGNTVGNRVLTVNKYGTGTLTLNGVSTYEGATTVSEGTLLVNGTSASSEVTVDSDAILGGTGTVGAVVVNSGGSVKPGDNGMATFATGNFTLEGTLSAELGKALIRSGSQSLADTDYDQVDVTGAVTLTGADLTLTLMTGIEADDLFFIINNDGTDLVTSPFSTLDGSLANLAEGAIFTVGTQMFEISYMADFDNGSFTNGNDVALLAVPEPGAWAMMLAGFGMLIIFKRARTTARIC